MSDEAIKSLVETRRSSPASESTDDGTPHELVTRTRAQLLASTPDHDGLLTTSSGTVDVRVSSDVIDRAMAVLDALVKRWVARGGSFVSGAGADETARWCTFAIGPDSLGVQLAENVDENKPLTDPNRRTSRLSVHVVGADSQQFRRRWSDTKSQRLERMLGAVIDTLAIALTDIRQERLDHECVERQKDRVKAVRKATSGDASKAFYSRQDLMQNVRRWVEHAFFEQAGRYEAFEGLCFVDTLDLASHAQQQMGFMTAANTQRVSRQKQAPITVVIGNPPYNANQVDESDNNKNRAYPAIDAHIKNTYIRLNSARKTKLYDPYVKFFRWASDRLESRDGIVCFVTNNSFVHQVACDGLQKALTAEFTRVYHFDLRGNVRQNPKLSGTAYNVFGIQVGVGITVAVRHSATDEHAIQYAKLPLDVRREQKLDQLRHLKNISQVDWTELHPDQTGCWFETSNSETFGSLLPLGEESCKGQADSEAAVFSLYSLGVVTNRDDHAYSFDREQLTLLAHSFVDRYLATLDRFRRFPRDTDIASVIDIEDPSIKWTRQVKVALKVFRETAFDANHIRRCLYRPFTRRLLYFDDFWNEEQYRQRQIYPTAATDGANKSIALTSYGSEKPFMVMAISGLCDLHLVGAGAGTQVFPYYVYEEDGTNRRENITDWALKQFRENYNDKKIDKWDIFYYVYGLLHHPGYREKFADNLKRELPRIPFAPDFHAFAKAGEKLARLHLEYEKLKPWDLEFVEAPSVPLSYRVDDKMRLSKDRLRLTVNRSLTLSGIPPAALEYRLGNRSALEWVIDQYQVNTEKRSGITSDPNRDDDPQYIVRLVGQVIRVSMETVAIVNALPAYSS